VTAAAALAATAAGCAQSDRSGDSGTKKDQLVFAAAGDPKVLDPVFASDGESFRVARQLYEGLVTTKEGSADIVPALATEWSSSPDGLAWTFKLRQNVKFHDGTDFNSEAVCTNFNRWFNFSGIRQNPAVSAYWQDVFGGFAKNESADLPPSLFKSCAATASDTTVITLTKVTSKFPAALSLPSFAISSPKALADYQADSLSGNPESPTYPAYSTDHPTGTGPYKFDKWDRGNKELTITRNDAYWGDKAKIAKVVFRTISDENARKQALQAGDIDGYDLVAPADKKPLSDAGFNVLTRPAFNILYLGINQKNPQLAKPEVRKALAHAINRDALVKAKLPEGAEVAKEFMPSTVQGYNPDVTTYNYDVNQAKQLLTQAGVTNLTLNFYYPTEVTRPYMPNPQEIYEVIKSDLEAAGIKVTPKPLKWSPDYLEQTQNGAADIYLLGWTGDYNDAYNFIGTFFGRFKPEWGFQNPQLFSALTAADSNPDANARTEAYKQINKQIMDFLPGVPISHSPPALVFAKNLQGVTPSPVTNETFEKAEFK
jgi:peptide/nickel transport system substrate-binding protein